MKEKNKKQKLKTQERGITLIALVITIVILIILATVSINVVLGEGSLIKQAQLSKELTINSAIKEQEAMNRLEDAMEDYTYIIPENVDIEEIKERPETYYGLTVDGYSYPCSNIEKVEWEIFYADDTNIYLIAKDYVDYVPNGKLGTPLDRITDVNSTYCFHMGNVVNDYTGGVDIDPLTINLLSKYIDKYPNSKYGNMQATAYMLDTEGWGNLYKGDAAEYAIGTPTLELFLKSYNDMYSSNLNTIVKDGVDAGYYIQDSNGIENTFLSERLTENELYIIPETPENGGRAYGMWLASPSAEEDVRVYRIYANGELSSGLYWRSYDENFGFRPVVCLKTDTVFSYSGGNKLLITNN